MGSKQLERSDLGALFRELAAEGRTIVGPTVRDGAIVYDEIATDNDLPIGWIDEQSAGSYRLVRSGRDGCFDFVVGPHSWKRFLHPPQVRLWSARREGQRLAIEEAGHESPRYAFIGVRGCELEAIARQDRIFLEGEYVDATYRGNRQDSFLVAVNCGRAGGSCFCVSMGTGPRAGAGYDLALTEVIDEQRHYFLIEAGSESGRALIDRLPVREAGAVELAAASARIEATEASMGRSMETDGLRELLQARATSAQWDEIAKRCLTCANCTMVCPTCFCTTVEDVTDLTGDHAERWRSWDSCFTMDFSWIHGGSVRPSASARYRHWMTHKLSSWIDQFGTSGCVGCGRCITWCPVGIDITEEVRIMREAADREHAAEEGVQ